MPSTISDFYHDKCVLVTGSTSFVGKVLLEKLLRCCPTIDKIYCLVRTTPSITNSNIKSNTITTTTIDDCFDELCTNKLFDRVRRNNPKFSEKLILIDIDTILNKAENRQDEENYRLLQDNIDVCFYLAANSYDFDEQNLKQMIQTNVIDLKSIIGLLKTCTKLKSIVYLSSIYANIDCPYIDETIYPCPIDPVKLIDALSWMDADMIELATPKLIGTKPNTFTFSHWLAETILSNEKLTLPPMSIVRVSMIGSAWKEPYPGWVEKSNGLSELFISSSRGYLRTMKGDSHAILDIVPVDIPVNLLIVAAWQKYKQQTQHSSENNLNDISIYHCTSSGLNPFHWQEMENFFTEFSKRIPYEGAFRRPNLTITSHSLLHDSYVFFSHLIPAYLADFGLRLIGKKPYIVDLYKHIHKILISLESFTIKGELQCSYDSLNALRSLMQQHEHGNNDDRDEFYFDIRSLHWPTYIESYLIGTKRYILNEDLNSISVAQSHLRNLRNIRWLCNTIIVVMLWRIFIAKTPAARNIWFFVLNFVAKFVKFFKISSAIRA
ncbi:unnamed protein product [Didymodactylos carnosus]|uniref:Fatty acyl-CoA reductase n=1 Tax=Didymodactylos carnosus TaxID=1234261 RepID=A0A813QDM4_9BILA|nr:unnamed protein product [Didymodactylos carnosus]CAF0766269.1 unnamed protein product [Didymodactylos carnosus]CAF3540615.1 unnamed protein product [Didymodactylos carnosus]CAF3547684.1 unnamed protein product [Didymodactylos carnosus]